MNKRNCSAEEETGIIPDRDALDHSAGKCSSLDGGLTSWLLGLHREFGWQLLALLVCAQHVTKGFVNAFVNAAWPYIMRQYAVPAPQMSVYQGVTRLPWALKPAIGVLSDAVPICGYSKIPYMAMTAFGGVTALLFLSMWQTDLSLSSYVMLIFGLALYVSTTDLLSEAVYARALRSKPAHGPCLLSFVWGGMIVAGMAATLASGSIISYMSPWALYSAAIWPSAIIFVPVCQNWMEDPKLSPAEVAVQQERLWQQGEAVYLAFLMLGATLILTWSGMHLDTHTNALVSLFVMVVVLFAFSVALNPIIAKVNAFSLIQTCLSLSLGGASFYFAMDGEKEFPDGPHFTVQFYNIVLPMVGSVCTLLGIWIYNKQASQWSYQKMYVVGNLIITVTFFLDIIFYLRLNKKLGLSDHIFVLGSSSIQSVLTEWLWMPSVVLLSQLCPKGMEAIMYANLAGCHNLGSTIAANLGAVMLEWLEIRPNGEEGESAQFDNLWLAALISSLLPLLPVTLVPWFIPDKRNTERILDRENMPANEGSLLRRWRGYDCAPQTAPVT